ncbi:hypothetical protein, partial [Propionicimonas sp.]|uniref:hypothetical protein n=1 Tax=Propionicimonas sp. TaxID=1955623 RepID=UPI0039E647D2
AAAAPPAAVPAPGVGADPSGPGLGAVPTASGVGADPIASGVGADPTAAGVGAVPSASGDLTDRLAVVERKLDALARALQP